MQPDFGGSSSPPLAARDGPAPSPTVYRLAIADLQAEPALTRAAQPRLFDRAAWHMLLDTHCTPDAPAIVVAARAGDAAAWLPLWPDGPGRFTAHANWYSFTFGPMFTGPIAARRALLHAMARDLATDHHRLLLAPMAAEDPATPLFTDAFRAAGWHMMREICDTNHVVDVAGRDFAHYWAARPGQLRANAARGEKRGPLAIEIVDRFDPAAFDAYRAVYEASWKPAEGHPAFLRALAEAEGAAGTLRLGIARADGQAVAAQLWTVENGVALVHKLAHHPAAARLSPGTRLLAAMMRHALDRDGVAIVDFGTGDDPYKRDWCDMVRRRERIELLHPGHPRAWPRLARVTAKALVGRVRRD